MLRIERVGNAIYSNVCSAIDRQQAFVRKFDLFGSCPVKCSTSSHCRTSTSQLYLKGNWEINSRRRKQ